MHFNFHLSGDESPEQSRRIANAVLALGGLLGAKTDIVQTHVIQTGGISPEIRQALKDGASAKVSVGQAFAGFAEAIASASRAVPIDAQLTEDDLPLNAPPYVEPEQFAGALTSDEIRAFESLPPAPPVPTTLTTNVADLGAKGGGFDKNGLPWDERIHSSSPAIKADGTWRYRKNVPDETKRDVEAELRGLVATNGMDESEKEFEDAYSGPTIEVTTVGGTVTHVPAVPVPPTPPAPPVPTGALQRTYSDVVNLIMARKVQPDTYVAILGMSLPEFAKHVISAPNDATLMFDALDQASPT